MNIIKFNNYQLNEDLNDKIKEKVTEKYKSLKIGLISLLNDNLDNKEKDELINLQNKLDDILEKGINNSQLRGFIEDSDVLNFYLKYQNDIDDLLKNKKYFDIKPKDAMVFSLYDYVITGTKKSIEYVIELLKKDLFNNDKEF